MIKAVLFGSLSSVADLTDLERRAFNQAAADHGYSFDWSHRGYRALCRARGRFYGVDKVTRLMADRDPLPFLKDVEEHFRDLLDETDIAPSPWFVRIQAEARRKAMRVGLVTGAFRQTTCRVLSSVFRSRASQIFDVITAAEDGVSQKPSADLFDLALARLSVQPGRALAFETTDAGIRAAQRAGIYTIARPGLAVPADSLNLADDHQAPTLAETIRRIEAARGARARNAA